MKKFSKQFGASLDPPPFQAIPGFRLLFDVCATLFQDQKLLFFLIFLFGILAYF